MACKGCLCSGSYSGCGTDSKCHAYYGRISASGILYCMGHCLSAVFSIWISIAEQESAGKPQIHYTDRNGRSFCICAVIPENPFCDRKLFPYDRNRSWCNPVWTMCSECTWNHCSDLPGSVARPWRTDNTWSKLFFHGDCRSDPVLADL